MFFWYSRSDIWFNGNFIVVSIGNYIKVLLVRPSWSEKYRNVMYSIICIIFWWIIFEIFVRWERITPTMNSGKRSVLIWGQTCITMLVDKGKTLSGDKSTRTDEHGPNIRQGRMARVWTNIYAYKFGRCAFWRAVSGKWMILWKRIPRFVCVPSDHYF